MKTKALVVMGFLGMLMAVAANAQEVPVVTANIEHPFMVNGKSLPAGEYTFTYDDGMKLFTIRGSAKHADALASVVTRAEESSVRPASGCEVVFDRIGDEYYLTKLLFPNMDGFVVEAPQATQPASAGRL